MGVENEKARNLSHLSLESIPKSINNENGSEAYETSNENHHLHMNGNIADTKEVGEKHCGEYERERERKINKTLTFNPKSQMKIFLFILHNKLIENTR